MLKLLFFILNLISNFFFLGEVDLQVWDVSWFPIVSIIVLSSLIAVVEGLVVEWTIKYIGRRSGLSLALFIGLLHGILIAIDAFIYYNFSQVIYQETLYILFATNIREATEFFHTYLSPFAFCGIILFLVFICYTTIKLSKSNLNQKITQSLYLLAFAGICVICYGVHGYVKDHNGYQIPQFMTLTRALYGCYTLNQNASIQSDVERICRDVHAELSEQGDTIPHIVVVIGESSSFYHCSVYDYSKETWPLMKERAESGSLIAYDHVTTAHDGTNWVMRSIYAYDSANWGYTPLFPAYFRSSGYYTTLIENEYFLGGGITFLCHRGISDALFDHRIDGPFDYDGDMIPHLCPQEGLSLDIIHLVGQHFTYSDRYPSTFSHFTSADYDNSQYTEQQRTLIAQYDNAALYCDYVLDQIMTKYQAQDCMLVFFSDHGEEVFEMRDYHGHSSAATAPDPSYLYRIPFFVWASPIFIQNHPQLVLRIHNEQHADFCTDHFAQWLLDIAGIH